VIDSGPFTEEKLLVLVNSVKGVHLAEDDEGTWERTLSLFIITWLICWLLFIPNRFNGEPIER
jgi:hypothetical protein